MMLPYTHRCSGGWSLHMDGMDKIFIMVLMIMLFYYIVCVCGDKVEVHRLEYPVLQVSLCFLYT